MMVKNKKIKVRFCPKCKSFEVGYVFGLSSWLGMSPRMRCKKCRFEMPSFPILVIDKKTLIKNKAKQKLKNLKKINITKNLFGDEKMKGGMKRDIITLCGSTKYRNEFREVERALTLEGTIPLVPAFYGKAEGIRYSEDVTKNLFDLHLDKIRISSGIFIIDVDGYIGDSTKKEIKFAKEQDKFIRYYSQEVEKIKDVLKQLESLK